MQRWWAAVDARGSQGSSMLVQLWRGEGLSAAKGSRSQVGALHGACTAACTSQM